MTLLEACWPDAVSSQEGWGRVPELIELLETTDERGRSALLLGLLAETGDTTTREAVRAHLDRYLRLLRRDSGCEASALALLYLVAHFPEDRERILGTLDPLSLDVEDLTRLERCLQRTPVPGELGRVWPSPASWALTAEERRRDAGWIEDLNLTSNEAERLWELETQALLAYSGAKALHAVER
jgi:hypothetical protein